LLALSLLHRNFSWFTFSQKAPDWLIQLKFLESKMERDKGKERLMNCNYAECDFETTDKELMREHLYLHERMCEDICSVCGEAYSDPSYHFKKSTKHARMVALLRQTNAGGSAMITTERLESGDEGNQVGEEEEVYTTEMHSASASMSWDVHSTSQDVPNTSEDSDENTTSGEDFEVLGGQEQEELMDFETLCQPEELVEPTNPSEWYTYNRAALPETFREQDKTPHVAVGEEQEIDPSAASLIRWRRRWQITKGAVQELLQDITSPTFRLRGIPKSVYLLDKLEDVGFACPLDTLLRTRPQANIFISAIYLR
jgi:hypothetical protein